MLQSDKDEAELLGKLNLLRKQGKIDEAVQLLKENTGKGKIIDPSDTGKTERIWSSYANPLFLEGEALNTVKIYREMFLHLKALQDKEGLRYHKGLPIYNIGQGFMLEAFNSFVLAFVEDSISSGKYPEDSLSTVSLQGIFKVDSEYLQQLSENILKKAPAAKDPNKVLQDLGVTRVPAELWTLEYSMQETERKLREFIVKQLSNASPDWWQTLVPEDLRKEVEGLLVSSSKILWFSEQPTSPLEYLSFPRSYIRIITCDACWQQFKGAFKHKAILEGRLEGLGHIRHKIAHYRKISEDEKQMFGRTIRWLNECIK